MKKTKQKTAEIRALRPDMPNSARNAEGVAPPPAHLTAEGKGWWRKICGEYDIADEAGLLLLQTALEAFDRMRSATRIVKREGASVRDRFGQPRAHPLLAVERDARAAMMAALRALNLDLEPVRDRPGRPPGTFGKR